MQQFVIDIETSGVAFEELDPETQEYLLKRADTPEKAQKVKESINLWPLTGEIVAIGILGVEDERAVCYFQAPGKQLAPFVEGNASYEAGSEAECLRRFWSDVASADRIITFNGRMFDMPWLMTRSLMYGIAATRNLMPSRYSTREHVDLADQLTFYGATRHYSLDFWCKQLGIPSPKTDLKAAEVPDAFKAGAYERIARYNVADLGATRALFLKWHATIGQV